MILIRLLKVTISLGINVAGVASQLHLNLVEGERSFEEWNRVGLMFERYS